MRCKLLAACLILGAWVAPARAQTFPMPNYFHELVFSPQPPQPLPDTKSFRDYVVDGKLRLSLQDAILLLLEHNTEVHIDRLALTDAEFNVVRALASFDPALTSSFNTDRSKYPTDSQLQGAPTLSDLEQQTTFGYTQTFQTGTNFNIGLSADKSSTNSIFYFLNPSIFANLNFTVTQPLLRGNGRFVNRGPILIARRNVAQSAAQFEGQVSDSLYQLLEVYWSVVQARENMKIAQKSQDLAQASYDRDKRALELGALPPLDIYRSEAEVANRKVAVIQAQYQLKSMEDQFRRLLGADQDAGVRALDLDLVENPEPSGELLQVDAKEAVATALAHRPELEALRQQMAANDITVRLDRNGLLPNLSLSGLYQSYGLGGNQYNTSVTPPLLISRGGLSDAFSQIGGFGYPAYGFTLSLNLPIKNHSAEANLGNAMVSRRRSQYQAREQEEDITLQVATAVHQLEQARISLDATRVAYDLSRKSLEAEERKYQLGAQTIFFVLQAQTVLASAEAAVLQAEINYQLARAAVDHATGVLLGHYKIEVQKIRS
ncbi:MAG TPA: TolC family protein [Terriglobia bacterium]|nr:TolC family protein [Terriglobia bacterium]